MIEVLVVAFVGACIYRFRGMGLWPSRPWWQIAFALPYALIAFCEVGQWGGLLVWALTIGAVLTGHASYIDLGSVKNGSPNMPADGQANEWYGAWLPGSGYWHDFAGVVISGLLISVPCGLALVLAGDWRVGIAVAASGILKAPAYAIAWQLPIGSYRGVAAGEVLTGALLWGSLALFVRAVS